MLPIVVVIALAWAVYTDTKKRKIPNEICILILVVGLFANGVAQPGDGLFANKKVGGLGFGAAALGAIGLLVVLWFAWAKRFMGAGDVKLIAALGAWVGWQGAFLLVLLIAASGGVLATARILLTSNRLVVSSAVLSNFQTMFFNLLRLGPRHADATLKRRSADVMPYAWAIFGGMLAFILLSFNAG